MKTDIQRVEWIDRYLSGELDSIEVKEFEAALSTDTVLAAEFADFNRLFKGFNTLGFDALQDKMQSWEQAIQAETTESVTTTPVLTVETPAPSLRSVKPWYRTAVFKYAAAAAVVFMMMPVMYFSLKTEYTTSDNLYAEYARPEAVEFTVRGRDSITMLDSTASFYDGIDAYTNAHYDKALAYFDVYLNGSVTKPNDAVFFYQAMANIQKGDIALAEKQLQSVAEKSPNYNEKAEWHLALLALRKNDLAACKSLLNKIVEQGNHEKRDVAQKLLDDLKRVK